MSALKAIIGGLISIAIAVGIINSLNLTGLTALIVGFVPVVVAAGLIMAFL